MHLLQTSSTTLDDIVEPVNLGQTPGDIARKRGYATIAKIIDDAIPGQAPGSGGAGFRTLYDDEKPSPPVAPTNPKNR